VWKTTDSSREFIERPSKRIDWIHHSFFGETRYESRNRNDLSRKEWNTAFQSSSLTFGRCDRAKFVAYAVTGSPSRWRLSDVLILAMLLWGGSSSFLLRHIGILRSDDSSQFQVNC
jgi:hypothetical protein